MISLSSILKIGGLAEQMLGWAGRMFGDSPTAGLDDLNDALGRFPDAAMRETTKANEASVATIRTELMVYPSATSDRYVRTYELQHGWANAPITTSSTMYGLEPAQVTDIRNPVPYTPMVQVRATQARWNRKRWQTVEDVLAKNAPRIMDRIIAALTALSNSF